MILWPWGAGDCEREEAALPGGRIGEAREGVVAVLALVGEGGAGRWWRRHGGGRRVKRGHGLGEGDALVRGRIGSRFY